MEIRFPARSASLQVGRGLPMTKTHFVGTKRFAALRLSSRKRSRLVGWLGWDWSWLRPGRLNRSASVGEPWGAAGPGVMTWLKEGSASTLKSSLAAGTAFNIEALRPAPAEASGWGFIQRHDRSASSLARFFFSAPAQFLNRSASLETVFLKGSAPLWRISKTAAAGEALQTPALLRPKEPAL